MKTTKKSKLCLIFAFLILLSALLPFLGLTARADDSIAENAESVLLYCADNGIVLYEKSADGSFTPSALTKMMTGLIACERLSDKLDQEVTITANMLTGASGERMGIVIDETMPLKDLLYGLLCCGYNDCATALAVYISDTAEAFVSLMNDRAAELGMNSTLYTTPTGSETLSARTTSRDTAKLALACADDPLYVEISSTQKYKLSATNKSDSVNIYNRNYLVSQYKEPKYYNSECRGLCAGETDKSKHSLATYATHGEMRYICVVVNAKVTDSTVYSYTTATELLKWAYKQYDYVDVVKTDTVICTLPVTMSDVIKQTDIYAESPVTMFIPAEDKDKVKISFRLNYASLKAPIEKGTAVGYLTVTYNTQTETVRLVTSQDIEASTFLGAINAISEFSQSRVFKASMCSIIVLSIVALLVDYKIRKRRNEYTHLRRK